MWNRIGIFLECLERQFTLSSLNGLRGCWAFESFSSEQLTGTAEVEAGAMLTSATI